MLLQSERRQRRCFLFPLHCLTSKRESAMFLLLCQFCQNSTQAMLISTPSRLSQVMHLHRVQYAEADPTCVLTAVASICARAPWRPSRRVHDVATTHAADGAPCWSWSLHPPKRHTPQVRIAIVLRVNACEFFLLSVRVDDLIMIWSCLARSRLVWLLSIIKVHEAIADKFKTTCTYKQTKV